MNKKILVGSILAALMLLLIPGISAINLPDTNDENTLQVDGEPAIVEKKGDNSEEISTPKEDDPEPTGIVFCILVVHTWNRYSSGKVIAPGIEVTIYDSNTRVKQGNTNFLGWKIFFGLKLGHNYRIVATAAGGSVEKPVTMNSFIQHEHLIFDD